MVKKNKTLLPVSVIVPMRNSATTLLKTLKSIERQEYPIKEIIIIDNVSNDNSVKIAQEFEKKSKIPIHILKNKVNIGVGASYNRGVKKSTSKLIVFLHSDSSPATKYEMQKLVTPVISSSNVVASYPTAIVPKDVWETYNFWQKYRFTRMLGNEVGFNGKFDCIRREAFLKVGGFDEQRFARDEAIGGEDADLFLRLKKIGELVHSSAEVIHYHYLGSHYTLKDHFKTRKMLARTYGRLVRVQGKYLPISSKGKGLKIPLGLLLFLVKPTLSIIPLLPDLHFFGICLLVIYAFFNSKTLYTTVSTIRNPRILLLPFIDIFLVYYETFWMIQAFIFTKKKL
jgi:glycosyltransferase involved in cell wall biosynthesis